MKDTSLAITINKLQKSTQLHKPLPNTCNYETDWDHLDHIAVMAYNIFPHIATGESLFFLMYG